jgi:hypothetical protein
MASAARIAVAIEIAPDSQCAGCPNTARRHSANSSGGKTAAMKKVNA